MTGALPLSSPRRRRRFITASAGIVAVAVTLLPVTGAHADTVNPANATAAAAARDGLGRAIAATTAASAKNFTFISDYQEELPVTIRVQHRDRWEWSTIEATERTIGAARYAKLPDRYLARAVLAKRPKVQWYRDLDERVAAPRLSTLVGPLIAVAQYGTVTKIVGGYQAEFDAARHVVTDPTAAALLSSYRAARYDIAVDSKNRITVVSGTESTATPDGAYQWDAALVLVMRYTTVVVAVPSSTTVVTVGEAERWPALSPLQSAAVDTATDATVMATRNRRAVTISDILEAVNGVEIPADVTILEHPKGLRFTDGKRSYCVVMSGQRAVAISC